MRALLICGLVIASAASPAVVLDRIAVIVGRHVLKLSDIERDVRVTQFLNAEPLALNAGTKRKAAERLVDQEIIRTELVTGGYPRATDADAAAMFERIRAGRFGNAEPRMKQALTQYGLTENELRAHLLWQLTVLRFIDERFRPGVLVTVEDIRAYYDSHAVLHNATLDASTAQIRQTIEGERVNEQFEQWLTEQRKTISVQYRDAAFNPGSSK